MPSIPSDTSKSRATESHHPPASLNRSAFDATLHCLTGCAIGEILGMAIATALGWGNAASIAVSIALAFSFGYALTIRAVLNAGVGFRRAGGIAFASDTVSITTMEIIDNLFILLAAMFLPAVALSACYWLGAVSADAICPMACVLMIPAMAVAMLFRLDAYTTPRAQSA